jgi:hypothetical protein
MAHWKVNEIRLCAMRNVDQTFCPKLLSAEQLHVSNLTLKYGFETSCLRQTFIAPVFIKIILMSLNEHCLHIFNCLLGSLFIYVYLTYHHMYSLTCLTGHLCLTVTLRSVQLILLYNLTLFNGHLSNTANCHLFHVWIVRSSSNNGHFGHLITWHNVYDRSRDTVTFFYCTCFHKDYFNEPQWTLFKPIQLFIRISFYLCLFNI